MIKEAMEYFRRLVDESAEVKEVEIDGKKYLNKEMHRYGKKDLAVKFEINTLTGIVDYIKGRPEELQETMILRIDSPTRIDFFSGLLEERKRETLLSSVAIVNQFKFDEYYDQERFLIELQANFIETDDLKIIMKVAGNVQAGTTANYDDDGVSQKTTIKQGVQRNDVLIPNPVVLMPYRTFSEVSQPISKYVFRVTEKNGTPFFKLVEADNGLWKINAMKNIKYFLEYDLRDELEKYNITIIA